MSHRSVFGIAPSLLLADRIWEELHAALGAADEISVLLLAPVPVSAAVAVVPVPLAAIFHSIPQLAPLTPPGSPPLLGTGPLATALRDPSVASLTSGLVDFGVPQAEADQYEGKIRRGGVLLSLCVVNPDRSDRARTILRSAGAEDIRTMMVVVKGSGAPGVAGGAQAWPAHFRQSFGRPRRPGGGKPTPAKGG